MAKTPKEIKIIAGGYEMTMASPQMIERVYREWEAQHPGCTARDMTPDEFAARMREAMLATAIKLPVGHA